MGFGLVTSVRRRARDIAVLKTIGFRRAQVEGSVAVQATAAANPLAQSTGERGDIEDAAAIALRFANGAVGSTSIAWTRDGLPGKYSLDVLGSESSLHLELDPDFTLSGVSRGRDVHAKTTQHPIERGVERFLAAARDGDKAGVFCTPRDAAGTLAAVVACEQALEMLKRGRAAVILYDRDLPGRDWREALPLLAQAGPVILTSRVNDQYLWEEVIRHGGYDVLAKPLQDDQIVRFVNLAWSYLWNRL